MILQMNSLKKKIHNVTSIDAKKHLKNLPLIDDKNK